MIPTSVPDSVAPALREVGIRTLGEKDAAIRYIAGLDILSKKTASDIRDEADLFGRSDRLTESWRRDLDHIIAELRSDIAAARRLRAPSALAEVHDSIDESYESLEMALNLLERGLDDNDNDSLRASLEYMNHVTASTREAAAKVENFRTLLSGVPSQSSL